MPYRASQICRAPGCGALCDGAYCARHETATVRHLFDRHRGSAASRGYGRRWRLLRRMVLARDPLCKIAVKCDGLAPSREADHIVPRARGGRDALDNLQGACRACHSWKTAIADSTFARRSTEGIR